MSSQQQLQQQPISVDEALKLFNEVQQLTVRDAQDNERFAESKNNNNNNNTLTKSNSAASKRTSSSSANNNKNTPRSAVGTEAELRRQLELSEAVMKKLHAKNKALTQEIEDLRKGGARGGRQNNNNNNNNNSSQGKQQQQQSENSLMSAAEVAELESLRRRVVDQDSTIKQLRQQNEAKSSSSNNNKATTVAAAGKPPLGANFSTNNTNQQENNNSSVTSTSPNIKLLEKRLQQMQQQYDSLMEVKLECIREGESTGKVNKEVKSFFVSSRQKMMDDAAFHEAERVLLNTRIGKLEKELVELKR